MNIVKAILNYVLPYSQNRQLAENTNTSEIIELIDIQTVDGHITLFDYKDTKIKKLIQSFKYEKSNKALKILAEIMSDTIVEIISEALLIYPKDKIILTYVPTTNKRTRERGYFHLKELTKQIKGIECREILECTKEIKRQAHLKRNERIQNVKGAFKLKENIKNCYVILLDDITTTGATLKECTKVLTKAHNEVCTITIARS